MVKKDIQLDDDAEKLFRELKGIETEQALESFSDIAGLLSESLSAEEERLDQWRIYLVETVFLISSYFVDVRFLEGVQSHKDNFSKLISTFNKLSQMPTPGKNLRIQYRGQPTGTKISAKTDYIVSCGKIILDSTIAQAMLNRMGLRMAHLTGRLSSAFEVFSRQGINTLFIRLPGNSYQMMQQLKECLEIIARFNHAVKLNNPIVYMLNQKQKIVAPLQDERGFPDANLTLVSALNNLNPDFMKKLIGKVKSLYDDSDSPSSNLFPGMYNAIFSIAGIRKKLIQPPVELNNLTGPLIGSEELEMNREKSGVARHIFNKLDGSREKKARVLKSVYGNDYPDINIGILGERIQHLSDLFNSMDDNFIENEVQEEIVDNVRQRFEEVQDDVYENLLVSEHYLCIHDNGKETIIEKINEKLKDLVTFFQGRAKVRKKIASGKIYALDFSDADYENLARDFKVTVNDAIKIIGLLKSCFNNEGAFKRSVFENNISSFTEYEDKVFGILWHYLKGTPSRNDRVAFLNSLQLLIVRMQRPEIALRVLLDDICKYPEVINYSDRNSFMLANLLVRKYNQELRLDIEMTPEEVLEVREGINQEATNFARKIMDSKHKAFLTKIKTIHHKIIEAIMMPKKASESMSLKFFLSLEREALIFLSLVEGSTAGSLVRSALKEYGNPSSVVYMTKKGGEHIRNILNHFRVIIRASGRFMDVEALPLLREIHEKENLFIGLGKGGQYDELVKGLFKHVRNARLSIQEKNRRNL